MEIRSGGGGDNVRVVVVSQSPSGTVFTSCCRAGRAREQSSTGGLKMKVLQLLFGSTNYPRTCQSRREDKGESHQLALL